MSRRTIAAMVLAFLIPGAGHLYLRRRGWTDQDTFSIHTQAGEIRPSITGPDTCRVDMGRASLSSKDFPGTISDHLVVTPQLIKERKDDVQKLVNAWYDTLDFIKANPAEATAILFGLLLA